MRAANSGDPESGGVLYLVATPIGNLEDITFRAIRILKEVDLIIAEDTRRTRLLLQHYGIQANFGPSLYEGADERRVDEFIEQLHGGAKIALVSDAGTPLIQDPGYPLVRSAVDAGIQVIAIPGPTALITALVASGLPTDHFIFDGVPSKKDGRRRVYFQSLMQEARTVVLYESPHRILKTLETVAQLLPDRPLVLCRELTKIHEEVLRGPAAMILHELQSRPSIKGEMVLIIAGKPRKNPDRED